MDEIDFTPNTTRRLDQQVVEMYPDLSRAYVGRLIDDGKVTVNDKVMTKASYRPRLHDEIAVDYTDPSEVVLPEIELPVLYEDDDCVVIDKPLGLLTHSKGAYNPEATVASWLSAKVKGIEISERAGIVHRLDRATSGVMICAKTPEALSWLQKQFAQRKVKKTYNALITGVLSPEEAIIDMPIERNPKKPQTFRVGANGKYAVTQYKLLEKATKYSLVELKPETGRTHQLRVHLEERGHPIVGDAFYGGEDADRLYLHAHKLELTLPNKERKTFTSPLPKEFHIKLQSS